MTVTHDKALDSRERESGDASPRSRLTLSDARAAFVRWWPFVAMAVVTACQAVVAFSADWLPMQDFGGHVEHLDIVMRHADAATLYPEIYRTGSVFTANGLELILATFLGPLFGVLFVTRLLVAFYLVCTPLALWSVAGAFGRPRWTALLAAPIVFNAGFGYGFIPFLSGLPLVFWAIAVARRFAVDGGRRRGALLTLLLTLTFLAHAITFLIAITSVLAVLILFVPRGAVGWRRLLPIPLSMPLLIAWLADRIIANHATAAGRAFMGGTSHASPVHWMPLDQKIAQIPSWGINFQGGTIEALVTISLVVIWLVMVAVGPSAHRTTPGSPATSEAAAGVAIGWRAALRPYTLELLTVGCFVGYFVVPSDLPAAHLICERWLIVAFLSLPLWIRVAPTLRTAWAPGLAFVVACGCAIAVARTCKRYEREIVGELPAAIGALPDRSALALLFWAPNAPYLTHRPEVHLPTGLHAVLNGGRTNVGFVGFPYGAADYLPGKVPAMLGPFSQTLPDLQPWDALLIWSFRVPTEAIASNGLALRWQSNAWWLFDVLKPPYRGVPLAGGRGGTVAVSACAKGEVLVGIDIGLDANLPRGLRGVCAEIGGELSTVSPVRELRPAAWVGARRNADLRLRCPENGWVTGIDGVADVIVRELRIRCSSDAPPAPLASKKKSLAHCDGRRAALGVVVRQGINLDAIGIGCE